MLIATCKPPKFDVPSRLWKGSTDIQVLANCPEHSIEGIVPEIVGCYAACPHTDEHFDGYFVLLVLKGSSHEICDADHYEMRGFQYPADRGSLLVVNTNVLHWLVRTDHGEGCALRASYWAALSWHVYGSLSLEQVVPAIVKQYDGTWQQSISPQYLHLRPSSWQA